MTNEQIRELEKIRDLIAAAPVECLGEGSSAGFAPWPIRDEVIHKLTQVIAAHARYAGSGEMVTCGCGDMFPHNSYDAGWIHAVGCCPNCHVADSASAQPKVPDRAALIELLAATSKQSEGVTADLIIAMLTQATKESDK